MAVKTMAKNTGTGQYNAGCMNLLLAKLLMVNGMIKEQ